MRRRVDAAFRFIERILENPEQYPDKTVVLLMDPQEIASILTKERLRLLRELQGRGCGSIKELARSVGRAASCVRKDLLMLERFSLVRVSKAGNRMWARAATDGIYIPLVSPKTPRPRPG